MQDFNRDVISTVILTSDYSVIRSMSNDYDSVLTKETKEVVGEALKDAKERLLNELKWCFPQMITLPKRHDVHDFVGTVDPDVYADLTKHMEDGFINGTIPLRFPMSTMAHVGAMRKAIGNTTTPDELFTLMHMGNDINHMRIDLPQDSDTYQDDMLEIIQVLNKMILAVVAPNSATRETVIQSIAITQDVE